jgi:prepilin-type N-terminal cleavage/methylation domain-containing protein
MNRPTQRNEERGFTLIELMVVMIVIGILAAAAGPFYRSFMTNERIKSASFDMMALLTYTRSEALKRNDLVTLNSNGAMFTVTTSAGTVIRQQEMFKGIQIDCVDTTASPHAYTACPATGVVYNGSGRLQPTSPFKPLEFHPLNAADTTTVYYRCITVDLAGRPVTNKGPC